MVIVRSDKILIKKSKDDNNNLNSILESILETSAAVCPLCNGEDVIITDPKSGEVICSKCGMGRSRNDVDSRRFQ